MKLTEADLEAGKSVRGGYSKAQLAKWGVPWPPPHGWKEALLAGKTCEEAGLLEGPSADDILRKVVLRVVERGQASILYDMPDVLAYFGARIPTEEPITVLPAAHRQSA